MLNINATANTLLSSLEHAGVTSGLQGWRRFQVPVTGSKTTRPPGGRKRCVFSQMHDVRTRLAQAAAATCSSLYDPGLDTVTCHLGWTPHILFRMPLINSGQVSAQKAEDVRIC